MISTMGRIFSLKESSWFYFSQKYFHSFWFCQKIVWMVVWAFDFLGAIFWPNNLLTKFCRSKKASFNIGFLQKIASLLASNKSNGFNFRYLVKSRCMKKICRNSFSEIFSTHYCGLPPPPWPLWLSWLSTNTTACSPSERP